jgi:hypothetical protein
MGIGFRELLILATLYCVLVFGAVAKKAGSSRWYGLLLLLPLVNIAVIWMFAFAKWPAVDRST